jgi:hypothetical protein
MTAFENAEKFFHACDSGQGWEVCSNYATENARFTAQSAPLADIHTLKDYVDWMSGFANGIAPGGEYKIEFSAYDESTNSAIFFASIKATHTGEGGPVPPTHRTTNSHYVYVFNMNEEGKVAGMTKIWNASWAMRELGWM